MKLVENWHSAWKWFSIQIAALGGAVQGVAWAFPAVKEWLGDTITHLAGAVMFMGLIVGRLIDQNKPEK